MTLNLRLQPPAPTLAIRQEPQICYVLLTIDAPNHADQQRFVNWALVADASRSMRIPIISEEQFRQLVRSGGAQEVLVDGVPVWQFSAPVPPEIGATSPSALDYVARALFSVVEHLQSQDRFVLAACAEDARLLAPGTSGTEREVLIQHIGKLKKLDLGNETDLANGLRLGLDELSRGRESSISRVERLILLTDGFTRNPNHCLALAREAAAQGIPISTMGLGGDFQDDLLMALADVSGGRASFVRHASDIPDAVAAELSAARGVSAQAVTLTVMLSEGVTLRRATSMSPTLATLEPMQISPHTMTLHLGDLQQQQPVSVLFELLAPPAPRLGNTSIQRIRLAQLQAMADEMSSATSLDLLVNYTANPQPTPDMVLDAAARANAMRLQRRALEAAARGEHTTAVQLLRSVAARLKELGEPGLASIALREAEALEHTGHTTRLGAKELTYSTRRLGKG